MPDFTPRAVTLPVHAWATVREAVLYYERRLRYRSARRPPPDPRIDDLDAMRADTLAESAATIALVEKAS